MKKQVRTISTITSTLLLVLNTSSLAAQSSDAVVPLSISVQGKLIISDAESDGNNNSNTLNTTSNTKIRIRTNLNRWQLTANRNNEIKNNNILVSYKLSAASKANLKAAKLNSIFNSPALLSTISK
ncbi:hypothetical protein, partial [Serratia marcescens]|uniref:hypothetical protein n=1 Tax=Serratia marcescens TaxID=615 RepID=UPI00111536F2